MVFSLWCILLRTPVPAYGNEQSAGLFSKFGKIGLHDGILNHFFDSLMVRIALAVHPFHLSISDC